MTDGLLSLSWNNHKSTFCHILSTLREKERYTDVTLACEGKFYPTHKLVLSTCSEYFEKMFENTPCKHPVILLSKDVKCDELEALLSYMYDGVVSVAQNDLSRLIKVAELLQIKGLAVPDEPPPARKSYSWSARDDRTSPPTKRRRREDNSYTPLPGEKVTPVSQPSSPLLSSRLESEQNREQNNTEGTTEDVSQRLEYKQETDSVQSHDNTDETLVKEEIVETVHDAPSDEQSLEFSSHAGSDTTAGGDDQVVKYPQHLDPSKTAQPLHEAVVEALAGPSGMQGWLGTGDLGTGFPMLESFSEEGTQDAQPIPITGTQQPHQMVELHSNPAAQVGTSGAQSCSSQSKRDGTSGDKSSSISKAASGKSSKSPASTSILGTTTATTTSVSLVSSSSSSSSSIIVIPSLSSSSSSSGMSEKHSSDLDALTNSSGKEKRSAAAAAAAAFPFRCSSCAFTSPVREIMQKHLHSHLLLIPEKKYRCNHCSYTTALKGSLTQHLRIHTGEKPYACQFCEYRACQKSHLTQHMVKHCKKFMLHA